MTAIKLSLNTILDVVPRVVLLIAAYQLGKYRGRRQR
jgi:hypothetical protein